MAAAPPEPVGLATWVDTVAELDERGVGFRSLTEAIDTTTGSGRLMFHVFAALAEFERDLIRSRTVAGLAAARARGRTGRPAGGHDARATRVRRPSAAANPAPPSLASPARWVSRAPRCADTSTSP